MRTESEAASFWRYVGKSAVRRVDTANGTRDAGYDYLLAPLHMANVGAVSRVALRTPFLLREMAKLLEMATDDTEGLLVFLAIVHDLGKIGSFQDQFPDFAKRAGFRPDRFRRYDGGAHGHDLLGQALLAHALDRMLDAFINSADGTVRSEAAGPLPLVFPDSDKQIRDLKNALLILFAAATGHHGRQPKRAEALTDHLGHWDEVSVTDAMDLLADAADVSRWTGAVPPLGAAKRASHVLNGFLTTCDWLGSHASFPMIDDGATCGFDLRRYWHAVAIPTAEIIVDEIAPTKFHTIERLGPSRFADLFAHLNPNGPVIPTPLQAEIERLFTAPIEGKQAFVVVEGPTGDGKTECADLIVQRLVAFGQVDGVYYGLPTMATADSAYNRKRAVIGSISPSFSRSFLLSHGRRHLNPNARIEQSRMALEVGDPGSIDWYAQGRRRALLGDAGVGSVDTIIAAMLRARHATVGQFGIVRKAVVVDEVHAYDDYMVVLLQRLAFFVGRTGGSLILMSATLPSRTRKALADAFCEGAGWSATAARGVALDARSYPLLTLLTQDRSEQRCPSAMHGGDDGRRDLANGVRVRRLTPVRFRRVGKVDKALEHIERWARAGRCVVWFRNTVADAVQAYQVLRARFEAADLPQPTLFHSRFVYANRLQQEDDIVVRFGKVGAPEGTAEGRCGRVVIATQVAEQSLDIDFDEAVIDLANADAVLQRIGRRRRHPRNADGTLAADGIDRRPDSTIVLVSPDPEYPAEDWYARLFRGADRVYPNTGRLWMTARHLLDPTTIPNRAPLEDSDDPLQLRLDTDARALVESVYEWREEDVGLDGRGGYRRFLERIPDALQAATLAAFAEEREFERRGIANTFRFLTSLAEEASMEFVQAPTDDGVSTRLGEQHSVVLAVRENGAVRLIADSPDAEGNLPVDPVELSSVRTLDSLAPPDTDKADIERLRDDLVASERRHLAKRLEHRNVLILDRSRECETGVRLSGQAKQRGEGEKIVDVLYNTATGFEVLRR